MNARWAAAALFLSTLFFALFVGAAVPAAVSGTPEVLYPRENISYPDSGRVVLVLKMNRVRVNDCSNWTFKATVKHSTPPLQVYVNELPAAWNSAGVVDVGTEQVSARGCIGSKRISVPPGKYSLLVEASNERAGVVRPYSKAIHFTAREVIKPPREAVVTSPARQQQAPAPGREAAREQRSRPSVAQRETVPEDQVRSPRRPDVRQLQRRPSMPSTAPSTDQLRRPLKRPAGTTTLKVRSDPSAQTWGTAMTIHHVQAVEFLWSTSVPAVASAEWQIWNQNPAGRLVPPTAQLATGALPVASGMSKFSINFDTLLPEYPPVPPATQDYWVTIETRNAENEAVGAIARPVKISYKGCAASSDCQELHYCDQQTHSCKKIEQFCVKDREIPGYKGTGYSKAAPGTTTGMHLQATDGTSVSCIPYGCKVELDGSAHCLHICESTADCAGGFSCSAAGKCVK